MPATMFGATRVPPFAIVEYTLAIWMAFVSTLWPNDSAYRSSLPHCDTGGM